MYAWIQPDGSWWINNAGAVSDGDEVLIIDTCATANRTQRFLDAVQTAIGDARIRVAVNTHLHGDHTYGNCLLPSTAVLVGHELMRAARNRLDTLARVATALDRHLIVSFPEDVPKRLKNAVQVA